MRPARMLRAAAYVRVGFLIAASAQGQTPPLQAHITQCDGQKSLGYCTITHFELLRGKK